MDDIPVGRIVRTDCAACGNLCSVPHGTLWKVVGGGQYWYILHDITECKGDYSCSKTFVKEVETAYVVGNELRLKEESDDV